MFHIIINTPISLPYYWIISDISCLAGSLCLLSVLGEKILVAYFGSKKMLKLLVAYLGSKKLAQKLWYGLSYRSGGTAGYLISTFYHVSSLSSLAISCKTLLAIMCTTIFDSLENIRSSEESPYAWKITLSMMASSSKYKTTPIFLVWGIQSNFHNRLAIAVCNPSLHYLSPLLSLLVQELEKNGF